MCDRVLCRVLASCLAWCLVPGGRGAAAAAGLGAAAGTHRRRAPLPGGRGGAPAPAGRRAAVLFSVSVLLQVENFRAVLCLCSFLQVRTFSPVSVVLIG
jgi:hypothetical protein